MSGGNTPTFLYWLKELNMVARFAKYVAAGGVLIGNSAGSILMSPDIRTATMLGDAMDDRLTDIAALNLVDFHVWPHFTKSQNSLIEKHRDGIAKAVLYKIPDGGGIIVNDDKVELIGNVELHA